MEPVDTSLHDEPSEQNRANRPLPGRGEPYEIIDDPRTERNRVLERFWAAVRRLPKYIRLAVGLVRDADVPRTAKAVLVIGGAYAISPVDLVPGIIPVFGQLDDLAVLLFALRIATRACPPEVAADHLERVGLRMSDFDEDLEATKDTAVWLAGKGYHATKSAATRGGRRLNSMWRSRDSEM